ncbi:MAG: L,D-transpeptidase family protein [Pseudomonadota bacterium]
MFTNLRAAKLGFICLSALIGVNAVSAQESVEWREGFDVTVPGEPTQQVLSPMVGPRSVAATEAAIAQYTQIVEKGGWNTVSASEILRVGAQGSAVTQLRRRLMASGDLQQNVGRSDVFDTYVQTAVRRFQVRHGIVPDGAVRANTFAALNVPAEERLRQLQLNLPRLQTMSRDLGQRYVLMNIPATQLEAVESGNVVQRHGTVVGKIDRQSPVLAVKISEINFNPFWTVPLSIIRKDLIPKMQKDPNYLSDNSIRIYDGKGAELPPQAIDWQTTQAVNFRFRQDPGDINSMGSVRLGMPNTENVYMHDTPQKSLFGEDARFHSSGCARVQNVRDLVTWLLQNNPEWSRGRIDQAVRTDERVDVALGQPVPVYWVYITAWANEEGAQFREDIYGRDKMHLAGDYHIPATPFDKVGAQAYLPGHASVRKAPKAAGQKPPQAAAQPAKTPQAKVQTLKPTSLNQQAQKINAGPASRNAQAPTASIKAPVTKSVPAAVKRPQSAGGKT